MKDLRWDIQRIQNKMDKHDLLLNSSQNDIQILGLSDSKLKSYDINSIFEIKKIIRFTIKTELFLQTDLSMEVDLLYMEKMLLNVNEDLI